MKKTISIREVREWFIAEFLDEGLEGLIEVLEDYDFFGTEGFNKRFA